MEAQEKTVIYRQNNNIYYTKYSNYHAFIQNARIIHRCEGFESCEQLKDYLVKYNGCKNEDFIIIKE